MKSTVCPFLCFCLFVRVCVQNLEFLLLILGLRIQQSYWKVCCFWCTMQAFNCFSRWLSFCPEKIRGGTVFFTLSLETDVDEDSVKHPVSKLPAAPPVRMSIQPPASANQGLSSRPALSSRPPLSPPAQPSTSANQGLSSRSALSPWPPLSPSVSLHPRTLVLEVSEELHRNRFR